MAVSITLPHLYINTTRQPKPYTLHTTPYTQIPKHPKLTLDTEFTGHGDVYVYFYIHSKLLTLNLSP